jgi:hypothetical protein
MVKATGWCWMMLVAGCAAAPPPVNPDQAAAAPTPTAGPTRPFPPDLPAPSPRHPESQFRDCGELGCKAFARAADAFDYVLQEQPRVLAVGEAHAQSDGPKVASATRRFMDGLLPHLAPRASDLVIELWLANGSCGKVEQQVKQQQGEVTAPQAATNQNEFVELGHRAKALGVMPHALVPSCEQYQKIAGAGADDIEEMLTMIKTVTARDVQQLLLERSPERLIVAYGGAMHNDLAPREGRAAFSFGPELAEATHGAYVELDLIIPEQIKETDAWRSLPWYAHYSRETAGSDAILLSWAPHAYALVFPPETKAQTP